MSFLLDNKYHSFLVVVVLDFVSVLFRDDRSFTSDFGVSRCLLSTELIAFHSFLRTSMTGKSASEALFAGFSVLVLVLDCAGFGCLLPLPTHTPLHSLSQETKRYRFLYFCFHLFDPGSLLFFGVCSRFCCSVSFKDGL